jgi:hypothetical protein
MGYLAYDPQRVQGMRGRMVDAHAELVRLRGSLPAEIPEVAAARAALQQALASWEWICLPVITRVASDDSLCRSPVATGIDVDTTGDQRWQPMLRLVETHGWRITHDADTARPTMDPTQARALGEYLATADLRGELSGEREFEILRWQLQRIAANPILLDAFLDGLGGSCLALSTFTRLAAVLADRRATSMAELPFDPTLTNDVADVEATLATLATIAVAAAGSPDAAADWLTTIDPYAAALLLRNIELDSEVLAATAIELMRRELDGDGIDPDVVRLLFEENTHDVVLQRLLSDAEACDIVAAQAVLAPGILGIASDTSAEQTLLKVATDPRRVDVAAAGAVIVPLIELVDTWGLWSVVATASDDYVPYEAFLGELAGPWLMQFTGRTDDWGWSRSDAAQALRTILEDDGAMQRLIDQLDRLNLGRVPWVDTTTGLVDDIVLAEIAAMIVGVRDAVRDVRIDDADASRAFADLLLTAMVVGVSASISGPVAGVLFDTATGYFTDEFTDLLAGIGLYPPSSQDAHARFDGEFAAQITVAALAVALAVATALAADGALSDEFAKGLAAALPAAVCDDTSTARAMSDYVDDYTARHPEHAAAAQSVHLAFKEFVNASTDAEWCE